MLDIKFIRENPDQVRKALSERAAKLDIGPLLEAEERRRAVLLETEGLRAQQNAASAEIGALLKNKQDASGRIAAMKEIAGRIDVLEDELRDLEEQVNKLVLTIPNIPHASIPRGAPENKQVVRTWGEPPKFGFKPLNHVEICQKLDIVDFTRGTKLTGSNFLLFKNAGARLERALINFMLDLHTSKHGYVEVSPPFLVNRASMTGTGQLPKLEDDMYRLKDEDLFLIPTAEVPVTNIFRDEILDEGRLPVYYTAYSACFRREAGSYGKDTKGLTRVHQFDKVEMVKFSKPENSYEELESLVGNAEEVLQILGIPYRVVALTTEDLSFSAAKCYDLEAYAGGADAWLEVSSCSNFEAFQARRANIRFRRKDSKKVEFVHTLNGSGLAMPRTMIAILENYQQADGSILIPQALRPYMNNYERLT
ncbi:MAG: serine--tRNA ligase [Candidatus Omnitrophica bacterium]|jgi:seryl-tRNA synthetase|nr:serine--tRNA ligase [Candidatus Omnitrophota bacterium]MDD5527156.1 serine--tRNA ligase [Candidatus Omnitrophota bacterium]